ncbi:hypothetical protein ACWEF6_01840 [Amycolatopsis sp. NPDC004772]
MVLTLILAALIGVLVLLAGLVLKIGRAADLMEAALEELSLDVDYDAMQAYCEEDARKTAEQFGLPWGELADWEKELLNEDDG